MRAGVSNSLTGSAVSSRLWPGDAALNVSMVSWTKGSAEGPFHLVVDEHVVPVARIPTHLQLHADIGAAREINANDRDTAMGVTFGSDQFLIDESSEIPLEGLRATGVIRPVAAGSALLTGGLSSCPRECVYLADCDTERAAASKGAAAFDYLKRRLRPHVESVVDNYEGWLERWWQPWRPRLDFFATLTGKHRVVVCARVQERPIFEFISTRFVPSDTLQVFAHDDDYSFGLIQSRLHWAWTRARGGKVTERIRYTSEVWPTGGSSTEELSVAARPHRSTGRCCRVGCSRASQSSG